MGGTPFRGGIPVLPPTYYALFYFVKKDVTKCFLAATEKDFRLQQALSIIKANTADGNVWIIGGYVFRNIVRSLYGTPQPENFDIDILVEHSVSNHILTLPDGWEQHATGLGSPRLTNGTMQIDIVALDDAAKMPGGLDARNMTTEQKLQSYFDRVPLTLQAIAYDVEQRQVIGEKGIRAILQKEVVLNNLDECLSFCARRKISVRKFFQQKASSLQFTPHFPVFPPNDSKNETEQFYERYAGQYEQERGENHSFVQESLLQQRKTFLSHLQGKRILDLGSGPGRDAAVFQKEGMSVLCVDSSNAMVKKCHHQGLAAIRMDIENIDLHDSSVDGIWAYASLVHIPKQRLDNALARLHEILNPNGIAFFGMVAGEGEKCHESKSKPGSKRFFALYEKMEFQKAVERYFTVLSSERVTARNGEAYLHFLSEKRKS